MWNHFQGYYADGEDAYDMRSYFGKNARKNNSDDDSAPEKEMEQLQVAAD
jgi:hypothetical protein